MQFNNDQIHAERRRIIAAIRRYAEVSGVSQIEIAERTGLQQPNVHRILGGDSAPTLDTLIRICKGLGINIRLEG